MMQFMLFMLILMTSILFTQMKHPLSMGMNLIMQTLLITLMTGAMYKTFWFSYILFLVFLGGMLVMFIYVTAISSNEMFTISNNLFIFIFLTMSFVILLFLILDMNYMNFTNNIEMSLLDNSIKFLNENSFSLNKLYNSPSYYITLFLINYLFLTLVITVKITNFFYGPLRMIF